MARHPSAQLYFPGSVVLGSLGVVGPQVPSRMSVWIVEFPPGLQFQNVLLVSAFGGSVVFVQPKIVCEIDILFFLVFLYSLNA